MSSEISRSHLHSQDSNFSPDIVTQSCPFTPIMELDGASSSSSDLQPIILQFAEQLHQHTNKQSIDILIGSRIYQSFEVNQDSPHKHQQPPYRHFSGNSMRTEQLFPQSSQNFSSFEKQLSNLPESLSSHSNRKSRKNSINFFCNQLAQLKQNVNKLITVINDRNPEEGKSSQLGCYAPRPSFELAPNSKQSLDAKSTESQPIKKQSICIDRPITHFQSPQRRLSGCLNDISPILNRTMEMQNPSNVSECSSSSLMRRKMKNRFETPCNSA